MRLVTVRVKRHASFWVVLQPLLLLLLWCGACESHSGVDLGPFRKMARAGACADIRNNLFLIDDQLVFWDRAGECSDAAYAQSLYGGSFGESLCVFHDSIAGPVRSCSDPAYEGLFDTITANLDKPDLGLGSEHTVVEVQF